jgi:hypothetical protein
VPRLVQAFAVEEALEGLVYTVVVAGIVVRTLSVARYFEELACIVADAVLKQTELAETGLVVVMEVVVDAALELLVTVETGCVVVVEAVVLVDAE